MKQEKRQFKFNDEFVAPKLQALLDLKIDRCIITADQMTKVAEILELNGNSLEELQAKRNSVVNRDVDIDEVIDALHSKKIQVGG